MTDWKSLSLQLIPAIVGSGLIVFAINTIYTDFVDKPAVNIVPKEDKDGLNINVTNDGRVPATNFKLTVETSKNFGKYNIFSTENSTNNTEISPNILKVYAPRLVHGSGSIIKLDIPFDSSPNSSNLSYSIYATYDQGSIKKSSEPGIANFPQEWTLVLLIAAAISFAIPYMHRRIRKWKRSRLSTYVSSIAKDIIRVHQKINENPSSDELLYHKEDGILPEKIANINRQIKGTEENHLFRTFYRDLESRDFDIVNGQIYDQGLKQRNKELMNLTTKIMNNVYWSDYNVELDKIDSKT